MTPDTMLYDFPISPDYCACGAVEANDHARDCDRVCSECGVEMSAEAHMDGVTCSCETADAGGWSYADRMGL